MNIVIQSTVRRFLYKINNLPNSIKYIKHCLDNHFLTCTNTFTDGRLNSNIDEAMLINFLMSDKILKNRINIAKNRHWYDISVYDYQYGWLVINIKSTTTKNSDNIGGMIICYYSLIVNNVDINKSYNNSMVSVKLKNGLLDIRHLKNTEYKKDYYFLVINKTTNEIIVNSFKGLTVLTPNLNNLPCQVNWSKNKTFKYTNIEKVRDNLVRAIQTPKPNYKEIFIQDIRNIVL